MSKYFYCRNCKKRTKRNVRLKEQNYCSAKLCQQARKNDWERKKKRSDPIYRQRRKAQHDSCLKKKGGCDAYQRSYRERDKKYTEKNRILQYARNLLARSVSLGINWSDLQKTDALTSVRSNGSGLCEVKESTKSSFDGLQKPVNPDEFASARVVQCGLYEIRPLSTRRVVRSKKIVKTDTLFAVIGIYQRIPGFLVTDCKNGHD